MSSPVVSVIMPCYNSATTLARAVKSVLEQTFSDFELIAIDDGSNDATFEILHDFGRRDDRVREFRNETNLRISATLNRGIALARAPLIARMDADDICRPERFARQIDFLRRNEDVGVLGTGAAYFEAVTGKFLRNVIMPELHEDILKLKYRNTFAIHPSVIVRSEIIRAFGGYSPKYSGAEDADLWYRMSSTVRFHNLPDVLIDYSFDCSHHRSRSFIQFRMLLHSMHRDGEFFSNCHWLIRPAISLLIPSYWCR